jgi:adenine-specific DNA-methyltransferase
MTSRESEPETAPMEKLDPATDGVSLDLTAENLERLQNLFPEAFREGKIDFEILRDILGDAIDERPERYGLTWNGKSEARRIAQTPSAGTLRPAPEESVDWDTTQNLFIEGDNLEVLKLLQKSYHRRVKLIYIDPPYNTGKEFIYPDRYQDNLETYLRFTGQVDDEGFKVSANADTAGRYHTNWLNMMYPRLKLARNLLSDKGIIFSSIDYHEFHNLRHLLDEVFGGENFLGTIVWKGATDNNPTQIAMEHEYLICYAKNRELTDSVWKSDSTDAKDALIAEYQRLLTRFGNEPAKIEAELRVFIKANEETLVPLTHYNRVDYDGIYTGSRKVHNPNPGGYEYDIAHPNTGETVVAPANGYRYPEERMRELIEGGRILFGEDHTQIVQIKEYLKDYRGKLSSVFHLDSRAGANDLARLFGERKVFTNPKPVALLRHVLGFCLDSGDCVLDFFAGSATTGQAVVELSEQRGMPLRYILVQLPEPTDGEHETIADIGRRRLELLSQSKASTPRSLPALPGTLSFETDRGFRVFKLDSSNIKPWDHSYNNLEGALMDSIENIKADRSGDDVLYEILLKYGLDLATPVEARTIHGKRVYVLGAGTLVVCLADRVGLDVIEGIAELRKELQPEVMRVVFRDTSFEGDIAKTNAVQILRQADIDDIKSL